MLRFKFAVASFILLVSASTLKATVVLTEGNNPQADEHNVLFNGTGLEAGPAITVQGIADGFVFDFTSTENLQTPANGQARIEAEDGGFNNLSIVMDQVGATFGDVIFNLNLPNGQPVPGLTASFVVHTIDEFGFAEPDQTYTPSSITNGSNFFTFVATLGERISGLDITTTADLLDIRQIRFSDILDANGNPNPDDAPVPEPATLALVGLGLGSAGIIRRKTPLKPRV